MTFDTALIIANIVAVIFMFGKATQDINWLKEEIRHLRGLCETQFGIARRDRNERGNHE